MISTNATQENQFTTASPDPRFGVTAPHTNPLVASAPLSVTKVDDAVALFWEQESDVGTSPAAEAVLRQLRDRAEKEVLRSPNSARAHANFGVALAKCGRLDDAIAELNTALAIDDGHYLAGLTLARVYATQGRYDEAKSLYGTLLERHPRSDSILLSLAYLALRGNDYANAERFLERALGVSRRVAFPHFLLGITRLQRGNIHGSIAAFREAGRLDVRTTVFHHALGVAYAVAGDYSRAERWFRTALALAPDTEGSVHALGRVLLTQGRAVAAFEMLKGYVELHPDDAQGRELFARTCVELGKHANARAQLSHILHAGGEALPAKEKARLVANIGVAFFFEGNNTAGEAEVRRALEIDPGASPIPYENLGRVYVREDRLQEAARLLERAKELFPKRQSVRTLLSVAYARLDRFDVAISELLPFWEQGIADANTYSMLGSLYDWIGDVDSALRVAAEANERFPRKPGLMNNLAYMHLMVGQVEEARLVLHSLPRSVKPHVELVATQGLLRLWEGDCEGGKRLYQKAQAMAREAGQLDLAKRVREKMHLELARASARKGDVVAARIEISRGLSVRPARYSYRRKLEELLATLQGRG
jgi:tetratricopeptide (TPR) repeat protein